MFYLNRGELQTAHELAEQLLRLAQSVQDRYLLSRGSHGTRDGPYICLGELASARTHLEQAIALYDPQQHTPRSTMRRTDPGWIASPIQPGPCGVLAIRTKL